MCRNIAAIGVVALIGICNAAIPPLADQDKEGVGLRTFFAPHRSLDDMDYAEQWRQNNGPKWNDPRLGLGPRTVIIETIPFETNGRAVDYEAANEDVTPSSDGRVMVVDGGTYYEDGTEVRPAEPSRTRTFEGEGPVREVSGEAGSDGSTSAGGQWQAPEEEGFKPIVQPVPEVQEQQPTAVNASNDKGLAVSVDGEAQPTEVQPQPEAKPEETASIGQNDEAIAKAVDEENAKLAAAEEATLETPKVEEEPQEKKDVEVTEDVFKKMEATEVQEEVKTEEAKTDDSTEPTTQLPENTTAAKGTAQPEPVIAVVEDVTKVGDGQSADAVNSTKLASEIVMLPMPAQAERFPSLRASRV